MLIGLRDEDRQLLKEIVTTFKDIGKELNHNLERLNKNLEEKKEIKKVRR